MKKKIEKRIEKNLCTKRTEIHEFTYKHSKDLLKDHIID